MKILRSLNLIAEFKQIKNSMMQIQFRDENRNRREKKTEWKDSNADFMVFFSASVEDLFGLIPPFLLHINRNLSLLFTLLHLQFFRFFRTKLLKWTIFFVPYFTIDCFASLKYYEPLHSFTQRIRISISFRFREGFRLKFRSIFVIHRCISVWFPKIFINANHFRCSFLNSVCVQ